MALLGPDGPIKSQLDAQLKQGIGHVSGLGMMGNKTPETIAKTVNAIQRYLVTETRLRIPAIFHNEAADPAAAEEMADLMRRQMRSVGLTQALSPVMDIARDARWGRVHETFGEDPYLVTAMSVAFTRGMQGADLRDGVLATGKHFLGYAMTEGGQNMAATTVGARELYDVYARPFEAAIRLCDLGSVMASYAEFDGVPIHVSRDVLTKLLRGRMGFNVTVVSDYVGVGWAQTRQRVAETPEDIGALALAAGSVERTSLLSELRKASAAGATGFYDEDAWEGLRVAEGSATVALRLAAELTGRVRLGAAVTQVDVGAAACTVTLAGGERLRAGAVVCALPVGPLRIDYGLNPDKRPGEAAGALHVTLGFAF